jgi:hypothetical protein
MITVILWCILVIVAAAWTVLFMRLRIDHSVWKTKKDFSFNEVEKMMETQDYKAEVSKYLHKYKSDRRWYENRLAMEIVVLSVFSGLLIADIVVLIVIK